MNGNTRYHELLAAETDPGDELTLTTAEDFKFAFDDNDGYGTGGQYFKVERTEYHEDGVLHFIRGWLGRRAYAWLPFDYEAPHRLLWTTAGNGTPVHEVTTAMTDPTVNALFNRLFTLLFRDMVSH